MNMHAASRETDSAPERLQGGFDIEDLHRSHILIVDDAPMSRDIIRACLIDAGYENISLAGDGYEALEIVGAKLPDLVILDLEMPRMDGFELCRRLRADPRTRVVPVLIQSGSVSEDGVTRAFDAGASDKIVKPVKKFDLLARVRVHLENRQLVARLTAYHDRIQKELEAARAMQQMLCPQQQLIDALHQRHDLIVQSHFEPCSEMGGDIWGLTENREGHLGFYIVDFSGHGMAAALNTFRLHTLIQRQRITPGDPAETLNQLNEKLFGLLEPGTFATMLVGCIDLETETLVYASAGAPPPLYFGPATEGSCRLCDSRGMPLGLQSSWQYNNHCLSFKAGSWIMLYSDALIETEYGNGAVLEEEGLQRLAEKHGENIAHDKLLDAILQDFKAGTNCQMADDLTAFIIGRPQTAAKGQPRALEYSK